MKFTPLFKYGSLTMTGLVTSTLTSSIIFTDSDDDSKSSASYKRFKETFSWSKIGEPKIGDDATVDQSDENKAHYINNIELRHEYEAPKYPIVLCHGLSGFDKLILLPSFNLLSKLLTRQDLSHFDAIDDKGGVSVEYWFGIKEALEAKGSTVLVSKVPGFGSIEERAEQLNRFITRHADNLRSKSKDEIYNDDDSESTSQATLKQKDEKVKINLIAHSMGGLDCRYLISELEKKNYEVVSLTTITTPHRGSEIADYCIDIAKTLPTEIQLPPGIYQLTTSFLKKFNETVKDDPNVLYMSYGACFEPKWYNVFFGSWAIIKDKGGANDGMVSVSSSRWGTYLGTLKNVDHLDLINWTSVLKRVASSVNPAASSEQIDTLALYLDIADNLAKRGF